DLWGGQQVVRLRSDRQVGIRLSDPLERGRVLVTDRGELASFEAAQIADDVRTPIAVADNANANHGVWLVKSRNGRVLQPETTNLVRALTGKHGSRSPQKDLDIEPGRPRPRILQIETNHIVKAEPASTV